MGAPRCREAQLDSSVQIVLPHNSIFQAPLETGLASLPPAPWDCRVNVRFPCHAPQKQPNQKSMNENMKIENAGALVPPQQAALPLPVLPPGPVGFWPAPATVALINFVYECLTAETSWRSTPDLSSAIHSSAIMNNKPLRCILEELGLPEPRSLVALPNEIQTAFSHISPPRVAAQGILGTHLHLAIVKIFFLDKSLNGVQKVVSSNLRTNRFPSRGNLRLFRFRDCPNLFQCPFHLKVLPLASFTSRVTGP